MKFRYLYNVETKDGSVVTINADSKEHVRHIVSKTMPSIVIHNIGDSFDALQIDNYNRSQRGELIGE